MRTGDQCRGGKAGAKCQQMGPEVVQGYNLAWGVKEKESPVPRGNGIFIPTTFLLSFEQWETSHHGKMKKRMLAANCTLILEAFQPRFLQESILFWAHDMKKKTICIPENESDLLKHSLSQDHHWIMHIFSYVWPRWGCSWRPIHSMAIFYQSACHRL